MNQPPEDGAAKESSLPGDIPARATDGPPGPGGVSAVYPDGFVGIRPKLLRLVRKILWGSAVTVVVLGLSSGYIDYRRRISQTQTRIMSELVGKGRTLVSNNSQALRGMAEDNAFSAVGDLVYSAVSEDNDIVYGIYMDNQRRPWAIAADTGLADPKTESLEDSQSVWASTLSKPDFRTAQYLGMSILEFAAPVVVGDQHVGTIRYGMSMLAMQKALISTRREVLRTSLILPLAFLLVAGISFWIVSGFARRHADAIAHPISLLTQAANTISAGNYKKEIHIESDDEVGLLARDFEGMRRTVKHYTENLEQLVAERTAELRAAQKELLEKAHKAGMADIATSVLHNIGNILNSVVVSGGAMRETILSSKVSGLTKANDLLRAHLQDLEQFMASDPRGRKLADYYLTLGEVLGDENRVLIDQMQRIEERVNAIRDVISAQQSYATGIQFFEMANVTEVLEDAIRIVENSLDRHRVTLERKYAPVVNVSIQKPKLVQIIVNLLKNAKEAMVNGESEVKRIVLEVFQENQIVMVRVSDTGCGIPKEHLEKIFNHGFTTKQEGHGFGLHGCANFMTEMGGTIIAESQGQGQGAAFTLRFPIPRKEQAS